MARSPKRRNTQKPPHRRDSTTTAISTVAGNGSSIKKMSFGKMSELLLQLLGNRDMYESYYRQKTRFDVELSVPNPIDIDFDIVRVPGPQGDKPTRSKSPKKKSKKVYEYFTSAYFGSPTQDHQTTDNDSLVVACRINPDLLELCFEISATEARALKKTDRKRLDSVTFIGGVVVRNAYFGPRVWTAALYLSPDEVFCDNRTPEERLQDLEEPVLLLKCEPPV